jgi:hypothetical protein
LILNELNADVLRLFKTGTLIPKQGAKIVDLITEASEGNYLTTTNLRLKPDLLFVFVRMIVYIPEDKFFTST